MESENTCEQSFKDDPENEQMSGFAEEASPEVGQKVSGAEQEGSGAEQEGSGAEQEGSGAEQEASGAEQEEASGAAEQACPEAGKESSLENTTESASEKANADSVDDKEKSSSGATEETTPSKEKTDESKVSKTVAQHYNELQESGLEARGNSRIFYLRNFNNWIKSVLIGNTLQKIRKERSCDHKHVVLDMCSGKGGDMLKWKKGRISKLICVDIASTSVEQSEVRFKDIVDRNQNSKRREPLFDAEFITADVTKQRLKDVYKESSVTFDLVSCQFALHYSFESYPQADMMLKNVAECLQDGGYFIGTTPNSYELVNRLRKSETNQFGNDVYKVEFLSEDKDNLPLFGAQYSFQLEGVVDCPEFLVYFPALEKLAEKYNLKLISKKSFSEFFMENYNTSENRSLLGRMQALEPYPAENDAKLISSDEKDYATAKDALDKALSSQQSNRRPFKAGTMSEAEWKAISLYMVFVFQKVKSRKDGEAVEQTEEEKRAVKRTHTSDAEEGEEEQVVKKVHMSDAEDGEEERAVKRPHTSDGEEEQAGGEEKQATGEEKRAVKRPHTSDAEDGEEERASGEEERASGEEERASGEEEQAVKRPHTSDAEEEETIGSAKTPCIVNDDDDDDDE